MSKPRQPEPIGLTAEERNWLFNQDQAAHTYSDLRGVTPDTIKRLVQLVYRLHSQIPADVLRAAEAERQQQASQPT